MLEVSYYTDALFEMSMDAGVFYKINTFVADGDYDNDPVVRHYCDKWFELSRELEDCLLPFYAHHIFVSEYTYEGDRFLVETDLQVLSSVMLRRILAFLQAKLPSYGVLLCLVEDMEIIGSPGAEGRMLLTLNRVAVTNKLKAKFQELFADELSQDGSTLTLSDKPLPQQGLAYGVDTASDLSGETIYEIEFLSEDFLSHRLKTGFFGKVQKPSNDDPSLAQFHEAQARRRGELAGILKPIYGKHILLPESDNLTDSLDVLVSEEGFSDEIVKTVLSFLRDRFQRSDNPTSDAASYSVRLALYAAGKFVASRYLGTVAVSLNRFGVSGQLKQKFKEKCRHSLHLGEWPLMFDENKSQRVLMRSRP